MRILDKYITKGFLRYYVLFTLFFVAIFVLTEFFTSLSSLKKEASILQVTFYYILQIPYLWVVLSPLSVIISALFTTSYFGSTNQLQAIQISGISVKRATLPLFTAGLIMGFSILFIENTLVYKVNQISYEIKRKNFVELPEAKVQKNIFIAIPPDYVFYIRSLKVEEGIMQDILIYKNSQPRTFTSATKGVWKENIWVLYEGKTYILNKQPKEESFIRKIIPVSKEPRYFTRTYFPHEKMNISELTRYIEEYRKSGFKTEELETELQFKVSSPFANFILMFIAVSLGVILKKGRGASLAVGLLMSFGYYETMAFFKILGKNDVVDPLLSAWIPNVLFLIAGIYFLYRMEKT